MNCADYLLRPTLSILHPGTLISSPLLTIYNIYNCNMTSALSKRHQARNERALQELIKTVPGNDRCADCGARNPGTPLLLERSRSFSHADCGLNRMGQLECESIGKPRNRAEDMADIGRRL